jgi:hypothetical protein
MVNVHTREHYQGRCGSARSDRCEYCAEIKRKDVAAIGRSGWNDLPIGWRAFWCSLTAPGGDVLPWDRSKCSHSRGVRCSGPDHGCQVEAQALAVWHNDLGLRWSHFVHDLRRLLNPGAVGPVSEWPVQVEFMKTYEPQVRGALHAHPMMKLMGAVSDARFIACYRKAAKRNGFGRELVCSRVDLSDPTQAARKAGYVAKYASKSANALPNVRRINPSTGEIATGGFRAWSASRGWGETMRSIHERRRQWAATQAGAGSATAEPEHLAVAGAGLDLNQDLYADTSGGVSEFAVSSSALLV